MIGVYPHASQFGPVIGQPLKAAHGDDATVHRPHVKLASGGNVLVLDAVQVVIPGPVSSMGAGIEQRRVVKLPDGVVVSSEIPADSHHSHSSLRMREYGLWGSSASE